MDYDTDGDGDFDVDDAKILLGKWTGLIWGLASFCFVNLSVSFARPGVPAFLLALAAAFESFFSPVGRSELLREQRSTSTAKANPLFLLSFLFVFSRVSTSFAQAAFCFSFVLRCLFLLPRNGFSC